MIIYAYSPTGTQRNTREHQSAPLSPTQIHITISELAIFAIPFIPPTPPLPTPIQKGGAGIAHSG